MMEANEGKDQKAGEEAIIFHSFNYKLLIRYKLELMNNVNCN